MVSASRFFEVEIEHVNVLMPEPGTEEPFAPVHKQRSGLRERCGVLGSRAASRRALKCRASRHASSGSRGGIGGVRSGEPNERGSKWHRKCSVQVELIKKVVPSQAIT